MFRRILVAVGGEEDAAESIPVVKALARAFDSDVLVIHMRERTVTSTATFEEETVPESFRFGQSVARALVAAGIRATADIDSHRPDHLVDFIVEKADRFGAELIVIGSHHTHNLRERISGDIGRKLAHSASCPLLLMPSGPE
jgi:nucleotide-binding universal stress UspA family protein